MEDKTIYTPSNKPNSDKKDANSPNIREDDYEWGKHPNSLKALKKNQYKLGQSGNVLGRRPTFESLGKELKKLANEETFDWNDKSQGTRKEQVFERIWKDAIYGDMKKIQLLAWLGCLDD